MDIATFDILLLFILAIAVSMIIGMNVLYIVDKKLSDVQINIPSCKPSEYEFRTINIPVLKNMSTNIKTINKPNIVNNSEIIEKFENNNSVTKQNEIPKIVNNSSGNDKQNIKESTSYQSDSDNNSNSNNNNNNNNSNTNTNNTNNNKIQTCRPYTDNSVKENSYNSFNSNFMSPSSNNPYNTTEQKIDYYIPSVYMGKDPFITGISYASMYLDGPANIDELGNGEIPINNYTGEPKMVSSFIL